MAVAGVICEYNPFHRGHEKQLRLIRERLGQDTAIVCLMSGNFVQRGAPAMLDKSVRATAAIDSGANLVLELPVTYCLRSAEGFAAGGVQILSKLGAVTHLSFGCETADEEALADTAKRMCTESYTQTLKDALASGVSYAAARQSALETLGGAGNLLREPNDILALEYCKAIYEQNSLLVPLAIRREGGYHEQTADLENPSATAVRALLMGEDWRRFVPLAAIAHYESAARYTLDAGERAILARLRGMDAAQWQSVPFGSEGLWSKVMKAVQSESSVEAIIAASKSRRYARTRLQRMLLCAYLGIDNDTLFADAPYVRVLGFDDAGRGLLRAMHGRSTMPIIHAGESPLDTAFSELERRCAGLYTLFSTEKTPDSALSEENRRIYYKKM